MNIKKKKIVLKSSIATVTLGALFFVNNNVTKAVSVSNDQLIKLQINNQELKKNSDSLNDVNKVNSQSRDMILDKKSGLSKLQQKSAVKKGKWGVSGPEWSYDTSSNTLEIGAGTIKGADNSAGAFADPDILKNVKKIQFDQTLKLVGNFGYWLGVVNGDRFVNLTEISGLSNIDTSEVTNMKGMFYASKIKSLDLSSWDTSAVTDMSYMFTDMFINYSDDESLNIGGKFASNTKNVKDMTFMFNGCSGLTQIKGVENLNTSSVTSMKNMFHGDYNLTKLDLSHFNTEKVTDMEDMLSYLLSLSYLDLSSFDTTQNPNMKNMLVNDVCVYQGLPGITTLILGSKTRLSDDIGLGEPDPNFTQNKNDFISKWRLFDDSEPLFTTKELIQRTQDGTLKAGAYTWKKQDTSSGNNGGGVVTPVQPTNPDKNSTNTSDKANGTKVDLSNASDVTLMHNAYLYDETGKRANKITLGAGSVVTTYGTKTINGKDYYILVDKGANNTAYYVASGNIVAATRKLKHNAYIYNQFGKRVKNTGVFKKDKLIKTFGAAVKIRGKKYFIIDKNRFIKAANFAKGVVAVSTAKAEVVPTSSVTEKPQVTVEKTLMHNAYLYDETGKRANKLIFQAGSQVETIGKKTVNGKACYELPDGMFIAAGNIDAKKLKLKHNAYVYNQYGHRANKKVLKKRKSVKTYGNSVKINGKRYFIVSKGRFVKKANF